MPVLQIERHDHVAILWLDNPDRRNAVDQPFFGELLARMGELDADDQVRVVVLAAKGDDFCVGLDLKGQLGSQFADILQGGLAGERQRLYRFVRELQASFDRLANSPKPVLAAVHGWCIGAGLDLISACDLRYGSQDARISLRETRMAIVADLGSLQRLPGIIGRGRLKDLALTGRDVRAEEAEKMGLLNALFPDRESLLAGVLDVAQKIAANPPLTVQGVKQVLNHMEAAGMDAALEHVALWNAAHLASEDLMEAMMAFSEKREPQFKGR